MTTREMPKRLGRGLAALMGESAVPAATSAPGVQVLPVDMLEPSPFQPRRAMDETALTELAESISQRGILQPLLVRPNPAKNGHYQIIAGERRWRAAQQVPLHEVPVLVRALSDSDAMAAGLVENLQREDLNAVEEALGYQRLIAEFKMTHDTLADAIGKSRPHITQMMRMLKLPESVLDMVREKQLSAGHARALLGHDQPLLGARKVIERGLSVRQTEKMVNDLGHAAKRGTARHRGPAGTQALDEAAALGEEMSERLGLKVKVVFNGRSGALTLHYESLDQLDSILKLLNG